MSSAQERIASSQEIVERTRKWIIDVVVACNFCPFAAREVARDSIHYEVEESPDSMVCLQAFHRECARLDDLQQVETTLLILPNAVPALDDYLDLVGEAEDLIEREGYEGVYQVASFHPLYRFADAPLDDPANYTNRSIYPMLHLLREDRVEAALLRHSHPEEIPPRNIEFARQKGLAWMEALRESCRLP
ncbi:MAG TPA: DUF1415 domain-containing protein [Candidatus Xenobia bacterium]